MAGFYECGQGYARLDWIKMGRQLGTLKKLSPITGKFQPSSFLENVYNDGMKFFYINAKLN